MIDATAHSGSCQVCGKPVTGDPDWCPHCSRHRGIRCFCGRRLVANVGWCRCTRFTAAPADLIEQLRSNRAGNPRRDPPPPRETARRSFAPAVIEETLALSESELLARFGAPDARGNGTVDGLPRFGPLPGAFPAGMNYESWMYSDVDGSRWLLWLLRYPGERESRVAQVTCFGIDVVF